MSELQIPIAKGGKGCVFTISDVDEWFGGLSPETQLDIIARGAKDALNSRMTKPTEGLGASTQLEKAGDTAGLSKLREAALEQAQKNFDDLTAGKLVKKTAKSSEKREVITRAVAMAREIVRNEMRKKGIKFSQVKASVVTAAATKLVEADPQRRSRPLSTWLRSSASTPNWSPRRLRRTPNARRRHPLSKPACRRAKGRVKSLPVALRRRLSTSTDGVTTQQ